MKMHSFSANQRGVIFTFILLIDEHELYAYKTHGTESSRHIHTLGIYFEQALLWSLPRILGVFLCLTWIFQTQHRVQLKKQKLKS